MIRSVVAAAALGLAVLTSACGGDGKSTSSGATKSGPAQKICVGAPSADVTLVLGASTKGIA
ncbi:MAG: hypothetical protein M3O55_01895, partial [Actinomycetota bacterium]|nr:hypothetical protein [Actinomycetota bacterium]